MLSVEATTVATRGSSQDRTTRFVFDVLGRARFTWRADNTLAEALYDPHGQVTESREFAKTFVLDTNKNYTDAELAAQVGSASGMRLLVALTTPPIDVDP